MHTILIMLPQERLTQADRDRIRALAPEKQLVITDNIDEIEALGDDIEIVCGGVPRALLPRLRGLRWVQQWGAGADWLMNQPDAAELDFILTNASGVHAIPISEHIIAMMLAFARNIHGAVKAQQRREWLRHSAQDVFELAGKTLLLVGVGAIGERTAEIAAALGMRVLGVRRNPSRQAAGVELMVGPGLLMQVLPEADFVVLTIPRTPETDGLIGREALKAMKPSAYIFNIGRGKTIQEAHLITALQEGWIAGAGLDVFEAEPLPEDSPLWEMENVIISAHYAGQTPNYNERAMAIFIENLERYQAGQPLRNVVDKKLAY